MIEISRKPVSTFGNRARAYSAKKWLPVLRETRRATARKDFAANRSPLTVRAKKGLTLNEMRSCFR
jgi:hypothetical protein